MSAPIQTGAKTATGLFLHPATTIFLIALYFIAFCFYSAKIVKNNHTRNYLYYKNKKNEAGELISVRPAPQILYFVPKILSPASPKPGRM